MSPCGEQCDMAPSLSFMRMQLSDDPDDFTWGRWYWCQPAAKRLDVPSTYGHPLWETDDNYDRGEIGFTLAGGDYARSRVSPFPGQDRDGEASWFLRGLPRDQRIESPTYTLCGAEAWDSDFFFGVGVDAKEPDGEIIVGGGGEGGGGPMFSGACPFPYGSCIHPRGGGEGGGPIVIVGSYGLSVGGGGEGGGPIGMLSSGMLSVGGGGEGGGPIGTAGGYEMAVGGGGEGGGPIPMEGFTPTVIAPDYMDCGHAPGGTFWAWEFPFSGGTGDFAPLNGTHLLNLVSACGWRTQAGDYTIDLAYLDDDGITQVWIHDGTHTLTYNVNTVDWEPAADNVMPVGGISGTGAYPATITLSGAYSTYAGDVVGGFPSLLLSGAGPWPGAIAGRVISGPGVTPGTTVVSMFGSVVTMSANASGLGSGDYVFSP